MKRISVTLSDQAYRQLEQMAAEQRRSISAQGGLLIEEGLTRRAAPKTKPPAAESAPAEAEP